MRERLDELTAAGTEELEAAVGELLFEVVALARASGVEPEAALRATARRFRARLLAFAPTEAVPAEVEADPPGPMAPRVPAAPES